jgi:hypothetical protein
MAELVAAMALALQPRLLLVWVLATLLPTAIATAPVWGVLRALDWSPRAGELARHLDVIVLGDIVYGLRYTAGPLITTSLMATMVAFAAAPWLTAMMLTAARRPRERLDLGALAHGATDGYEPMARLFVVSLLPRAAVAGLGYVVYHVVNARRDHALLESQADLATYGGVALLLVVVTLAHATFEAARAQVAADAGLHSAWHAWRRGLVLLANRPLALLVLHALPTLASLLVAALILLVRLRVHGASIAPFWLAFALTQLAVAAIGWGRAARLFALTALAASSGARALPSSQSISVDS